MVGFWKKGYYFLEKTMSCSQFAPSKVKPTPDGESAYINALTNNLEQDITKCGACDCSQCANPSDCTDCIECMEKNNCTPALHCSFCIYEHLTEPFGAHNVTLGDILETPGETIASIPSFDSFFYHCIDKDDTMLSLGAIIGIVLGCLAFLVLMVLLFWYGRKHRWFGQKESSKRVKEQSDTR